VAGYLADYFDPFSIESICAAVIRVSASQKERRQRIREQRRALSERVGYQTQARDFLASCPSVLGPHLATECLVATNS
jgi:hypothetical protein